MPHKDKSRQIILKSIYQVLLFISNKRIYIESSYNKILRLRFLLCICTPNPEL